jgi:hypothetical protein
MAEVVAGGAGGVILAASDEDREQRVTDEELLDIILELIDKDPWIFFVSILTTISVMLVFLTFVVWGVSRAGRFNPPVVVLTVVLGLISLMSLLAYALAPSTTLGNVVMVTVGALAGALGSAWAEQKWNDKEAEYVAEKQSRQSEGDSGDAGQRGGEPGDGAGDGDLAGLLDGDAGGDGPGSPRSGRDGAPWVDRE